MTTLYIGCCITTHTYIYIYIYIYMYIYKTFLTNLYVGVCITNLCIRAYMWSELHISMYNKSIYRTL